MDRVEELTGIPIGDMSDSIDASPALQTQQAPRKALGGINETSKALSSILRIAGHSDTNSVGLTC
jgi:hypothetical protein